MQSGRRGSGGGVTRRPVVGVAVVVFLVSVGSWPQVVWAQQRPLLTEDPESIGAGLILIESGVDFLHGQRFPVTGLKGDLWQAPTLGLSFGLSSIAELQLDANLMHLTVTDRFPTPIMPFLNFDGDKTYSPGDITVGTKVRLLPEGTRRPGMGAPVRHPSAQCQPRERSRDRDDGLLLHGPHRQDDSVRASRWQLRVGGARRHQACRSPERRRDLWALGCARGHRRRGGCR